MLHLLQDLRLLELVALLPPRRDQPNPQRQQRERHGDGQEDPEVGCEPDCVFAWLEDDEVRAEESL